MEIRDISDIQVMAGHRAEFPRSSQDLTGDFKSHLAEELSDSDSHGPVVSPAFPLLPADIALENIQKILSAPEVIPAYQEEVRHNVQMNDWQKYGDAYYLEEGKVISDHEEQESFWGRTFQILSTT